MSSEPKVLIATTRSWHLPQVATGLESRGALASLWMADKNRTGISAEKYVRCWPYHLAMKPFYHLAPQIWDERATYMMIGLWKSWLQTQMASRMPEHNVVHAIMGFATEPFDVAERTGALKVLDCPNSHPTTYNGYWQRECDLWCPGEKVPIPWWMFSRMNRELERADLILCPSLFVRDTMLLNGIPSEKCFVNPFGVNCTIFKQRNEVPKKPRFVSVGTICVRKGYQYLFRAFELVKKKLPSAELVIVGDYKADFRKERPKWEGTFTHHPHLSHVELAQLLQTCTAFVFPSQEEGFARVIPEAMGAGLPIIASYESGATTLVENGCEGFIINGRDPQHIAEAMIGVTKDRELNLQLGAASYKKGAMSNSWQDYSDRLVKEYALRLNAKIITPPS